MASARETTVLQLHLPDGWPQAGGQDAIFRYALRRGGERDMGTATLADLPPAGEVVAVAPASAVTYVRVVLPDVRGARLAQLLPMAVEDAVASSPEAIHAVLVEHAPGEESLVAVVERTWLREVLDALRSGGVHPSRLVVESELAVQRAAAGRIDAWFVVLKPSGGFVASSHGALAALDVPDEPGRVPVALRRLCEEHAAMGRAPDELVVFGAEGTDIPDVRVWGRVIQLPVRAGGRWRPEKLDVRRGRATDLLQGEFAGARTAGGVPLAVKAAAVAAGVLLAVHAALTVADWVWVWSETRTLNARMEGEFRRLFPETSAVVDAPLQLERRLAALRRESGAGDRSDVLPLLAAASGPIAGLVESRVERVRYERGELEVELLLRGTEGRQALENRLAVPGYRVRLERLSREADGQVAVVRVGAGG
jgi:general secretion pathway protein L